MNVECRGSPDDVIYHGAVSQLVAARSPRSSKGEVGRPFHLGELQHGAGDVLPTDLGVPATELGQEAALAL